MGREPRSMELSMNHLSFQRELQLVQANVRLTLHGEVLIDEPLCIDVGLPALVNSCFENVEPRVEDAGGEAWKQVPFFVCGCGDPQCRVYAFRVERPSPGYVQLTEIVESPDGSVREYGAYRVPEADYREAVLRIAQQFLAFVEGIDYRPLRSETVSLIRECMEKTSGY